MSKVYLAIPKAPDKLLGYVSDDGKIYRSRVGIDEHVGGAQSDIRAIKVQRPGGAGHVIGQDIFVSKSDGTGSTPRR